MNGGWVKPHDAHLVRAIIRPFVHPNLPRFLQVNEHPAAQYTQERRASSLSKKTRQEFIADFELEVHDIEDAADYHPDGTHQF